MFLKIAAHKSLQFEDRFDQSAELKNHLVIVRTKIWSELKICRDLLNRSILYKRSFKRTIDHIVVYEQLSNQLLLNRSS